MRFGFRLLLSASALLVSWVGHSSAAPLVPISGVTGPTGGLFGDSIVTNVDLQEGPGSVALGDSDSLATSTTPPGNDYWNAGTTLTFDLGATYNLSDLLIWNNTQNQFQDFGTATFSLSFSTTGTPGSFSTPVLETLTENAFGGTQNGQYNVAAQIIPYSATARYVDLTLISSYAAPDRIAQFGNLAGLDEVNFVEAAPEPSTYAMVVPGLVGLMWFVRRKPAFRG